MKATDNLIPLKCENCSKTLFFYEGVKDGTVSKDCPKCGHRNVIKFEELVGKKKVQDEKIK